MKSRLSCSEYSFGALPTWGARIATAAALGFQAVDVGLFFSSDRELVTRSAAIADEIAAAANDAGIAIATTFFSSGQSFSDEAPNSLVDADRKERRRAFLEALQVTEALGCGQITVLPGIVWPRHREKSWEVAVDELAWRCAEGRARCISVNFEPHAGSLAALPEAAADLAVEVSGLQIALDPAHFAAQVVEFERVLELAPLVAHVHVRGARPAVMQSPWSGNEIDYRGLAHSLEAAGYRGYFAIEYVSMPVWRCDEVDVMREVKAAQGELERIVAGLTT